MQFYGKVQTSHNKLCDSQPEALAPLRNVDVSFLNLG